MMHANEKNHVRFLWAVLVIIGFCPVLVMSQASGAAESSIPDQIREQEQFKRLTPEQRETVESVVGHVENVGARRVASLGTTLCQQHFQPEKNGDKVSSPALVSDIVLTGYPSADSRLTSISACVWTVGPEPLESAELVMTATDGEGHILKRDLFSGAVLPVPLSVQSGFSFVGGRPASISVRWELRNDGKLVYSMESAYSCAGKEWCSEKNSDRSGDIVVLVGIGSVLVLSLIGIGIWLYMKKKYHAILSGIIIFLGVSCVSVLPVRADSCTYTPATANSFACSDCTGATLTGCSYEAVCCGPACYTGGAGGELGFGYYMETCPCPPGQTGGIFSYYFMASYFQVNSCTVDPVINGACGSANGIAVSSAPSTNLCTSGAPSSVSVSTPWTWTCVGLSGGTTASCSAPFMPPSTLRLCQNGILYTSSTQPQPGAPITFAQGESRNLTAYYDSGSGCSGASVASLATFVSSEPAIGILSGSDPKILLGAVPDASSPGQQADTATVTVTYSGQAVVMPLSVLENCTPASCSPEENHICKGEVFNVTDGCGFSHACTGIRSCSNNWKEVAPGV